MGLDITAYGPLIPAPGADPNTDDDVIEIVKGGWNDPEFEGRCNVEPGIYKFGESFGFGAGSYSGYNTWRSWLATVAGFKDDADAWEHKDEQYPFRDLIWFSDCEGTLDATVSAKLLADFIAFEDKAREADVNGPFDGYNFQKYQDWKRAFEIASRGGVVKFH